MTMAQEEVESQAREHRAPLSRPMSRRGSLMLALAGLAGVIAVVFTFHDRGTTRSSTSTLASVVTNDARSVEGRLSGGFAWAPYRSGTRRNEDGGVDSAVATILAKVRGDASPEGLHTAGVAQLLAGRTRRGLAALEQAAATANDPRIWSDLAAAYQQTSVHYEAPELLAEALAAADRALTLDPALSEALFNRALVIEHLGLRDDARQAWERYLATDTTTGWAMEARQHLQAVQPEPTFLQLLDRDPELSAERIRTLARHDPQAARGSGVMEVLGRWGRATKGGDRTLADRHLRIARQLGAEVARINGDQTLESGEAAIEKADDSRRALLAGAHVDYQDGLKAFQGGRPGEAEALLRRAGDAFERAGSPMALMARYFAANTTFEQGRKAEAQRQLEQLLAITPSSLPSLRAQLLWELGVCHSSSADWGEAIGLLEQSAGIFDGLGEIANAGAVRRILAFVYDTTGDPTRAWRLRMLALRGIGRRSSLPLVKTVASIAEDAANRKDWSTAASFLTLEIGIARRIQDDIQLADALLVRAAVRHELHDRAAADADIAEAAAASSRSKDAAYRDYIHCRQLFVRAMLTSSPSEANALLTQAIAFQSTKGDRLYLPGLYLQRARALRASGDPAEAAADLQRGMTELEAHRESLPQGESRWGAFHSAEELFEEAIDLAMEHNDASGAFAIAERARARALIDSYGRSPAVDYRQLPAGTTLVEYAVLPTRLVIFAVSDSGVRAVSIAGDRNVLAAKVDALAKTLRTEASPGLSIASRRSALGLYRQLLEPVEPELLPATTLAIVPDAVTSTIPFSALIDSHGEYLIAQRSIVIAPSAAVFSAASDRARARPAPRSVLVIANSESDTRLEPLNFVNGEAKGVSSAYAHATQIAEDSSQFEELEKRASEADVIHFAGHAIGDPGDLEPASIVLHEKNRERRVRVPEIASLRLARTSVVVLAGCNTARGERRSSEGVISVAHGFLTAGAPSVIATLWPINDQASAAFFPRLHQRLAAGVKPAEALREVQLEAIHRGDVPVSLWAALQDIGS